MIWDIFQAEGKNPIRRIALKINNNSLKATLGSSQIIFDVILSLPGDFFVLRFLTAVVILENRSFMGDNTTSFICGMDTSEFELLGVNTSCK